MQIEIRNDSVVVSGYVNAIERDSRVMNSPQGKFVEVVKTKTFQRALENASNVDLLLNHKAERKLGSTSSGELTLTEDNIGLRAMATITDPETMQKAKDKKLVGWSFGFSSNKDSWQATEDGIQRRFLEDINLLEVSILDNTKTPAYIGTSIESRDNESMLLEHRATDDVAETIDNSTPLEPIKHDYSIQEAEIELLKLRH